MEDPELAEGRSLVMERRQTLQRISATLVSENSENSSLTDVTEILSLDPRRPPKRRSCRDGLAPSPLNPVHFNGRKNRRTAGLAMKPGEVVVSRRLYRSGQTNI